MALRLHVQSDKDVCVPAKSRQQQTNSHKRKLYVAQTVSPKTKPLHLSRLQLSKLGGAAVALLLDVVDVGTGHVPGHDQARVAKQLVCGLHAETAVLGET